ncbi:hypothetical protein M8J77_019135 [Diaphorina citri]|nr:hypothetical protein M8J77_019135 [Diaphorina citri]
MGSIVCCVEKFPGEGAHYARAAGNSCTLVRTLHDRVVLQLPSKHEVAVDKHCMAVVVNKIRPLDTFQLTIPSLGIKTKAIRKTTGLGWHEEPLYEKKLRKLREEEEELGAFNSKLTPRLKY